jgi:small subunit ribosomal protein S4
MAAMAREPKHKVSRRFGFDVYGTGGRQLERRLASKPAGRPAGRPRRRSEYGLQLTEKQNRRYFGDAERMPGNTGDNLLSLLERRLDNVVYRIGAARSRPMARQLVSHGHVLVNGQRVTIPSYRLGEGDVITLTSGAAKLPGVVEELGAGRPLPEWLAREGQSGGRVSRLPQRSDVELPIDERLIISFYAR